MDIYIYLFNPPCNYSTLYTSSAIMISIFVLTLTPFLPPSLPPRPQRNWGSVNHAVSLLLLNLEQKAGWWGILVAQQCFVMNYLVYIGKSCMYSSSRVLCATMHIYLSPCNNIVQEVCVTVASSIMFSFSYLTLSTAPPLPSRPDLPLITIFFFPFFYHSFG